jgi:hypothetical protein
MTHSAKSIEQSARFPVIVHDGAAVSGEPKRRSNA